VPFINIRPVLLVTGLLPALAFGNAIVDQNQATIGESFTIEGGILGLAQSFQTTEDNIAGIGGVLIRPAVPIGGDIILSLFDALPSSGGTALYSATIPVTFTGAGAGGMNSLERTFAPIATTPGATYFMVVQTAEPFTFAAAQGNPYAQGQTFTLSAGASTAAPDFDLRFRTFTETDFDAPAPVPEPGTAALLLAGLASVAVARGRRDAVNRTGHR